MKLTIELTDALSADLENASILCSGDWSEDMAISAMNIVELVWRAKKQEAPQTHETHN